MLLRGTDPDRGGGLGGKRRVSNSTSFEDFSFNFNDDPVAKTHFVK